MSGDEVPFLLGKLQEAVERARAERRTENEARKCSQSGCPGDGRYAPPGRGHLPGCKHDAVTWVWETVRPTPPADPGGQG